jgi:hypothetical protein
MAATQAISKIIEKGWNYLHHLKTPSAYVRLFGWDEAKCLKKGLLHLICALGWIEREFFRDLRVAWDLKNKVLVPVNPFRNMFVFCIVPEEQENLWKSRK